MRVLEAVEELLIEDLEEADPEPRDDDFAKRLHLFIVRNEDEAA